MGASNIFFVFKGQNGKKAHIVTPALEDLILPGVTRDSIIVRLKIIIDIFIAASWIFNRRKSNYNSISDWTK